MALQAAGTPSGRLIVYLQPVPHENPLWGSVSRFFEESLALGATEAHMYHPHCSVVGFIDAGAQRSLVIRLIVETLGRWPLHKCSVGVDSARFVEADGSQAQIGVRTNGFRELAAVLHDALKPYGVHVRPKPLDHMSLAYISDRLTGGEVDARRDSFDAEQYASLARRMLQPADDSGVWEVVLLEQTHRATDLGSRHVFVKLQSWPLEQQNRASAEMSL